MLLLVPPAYRLPVSVIMFLTGKAVGALCLNVFADGAYKGYGFDRLVHGLQGASDFDPHALLYIVLPPLLYESASSLSWRVLRKVLPSASLLAVPGVLLNTLLTGVYVKGAVSVQGGSPTWATAWLLASILSATDPVAVVSALSSLGAPQKLSALIEGESLLNDGVAVVLTYVLKEWAINSQAPTVEYVTCQFLQVACGGCGAGVLAGVLLNAWVKRARGHYRAVLEVGIVIGSVYGTFLIAEALHTSGVLAVVTLGFIMSAHISAQLSHEGRHAHHVVFGQIGHACNQITFFTSGIISARFLFARAGCFSDHIWLHPAAWLELLGLYVTVHLTRAAVVVVFHPLLDRMGYGITWKESAVLVYGGLRGAVGLVMSLVVEHSAARTEHRHASQMIAFHTSGIVLLTLLINGSTVGQVYRWLKLYPMSPFRKTYLQKVLAKLEVECQKGDLKQITRDWFLQDCSLRSIVGCMPNFCHLDFDPAGVPHPAGILSTAEVLRCLEAESNWHMEQTTLQRRLSFTRSFRDRWAQRKLESEERFVELLRGSAGQAADRKDYLSRGIQSFGDRELGLQRTHTGASVYVSMWPLSALGFGTRDSGAEESFSFEVSLLRPRRAAESRVVVGLLVGLEGRASAEKLADLCAGHSPLLGVAWGSVGLDTATGEISACLSEGDAAVVVPAPDGWEGPMKDNSEVSVQLVRLTGQDWKVVFTVVGPDITPFTFEPVSMGGLPPSDLHPAVEFKKIAALGLSHSLSRLGLGSLNPATRSSECVEEAPQVGDRSDAAERRGSPDDGSPRSSSSSPGERRAGGRGAQDTASPTSPSSRNAWLAGMHQKMPRLISTAGNSGSSESIKETGCTAQVRLSFDLVLTTDADCINQLFNVLFNTMRHVYCEMHEHGIIGDVALAWLTEAVGEAMDCAGHEVNARTATDFRKHNATYRMRPSQAAEEGPDAECRPRGRTVCSVLPDRPHWLPSHLQAPSELLSSIWSLREKDPEGKLAGLFEPILVEYLSVEAMVSKVFFWDALPIRLQCLQQHGYGTTRAKVEALWAFVVAHEKVVEGAPILERFPVLVQCIRRVVDVVRTDLGILEELQPRRFFYAKHALALRVMMNRRLEKVRRLTEEGWLSSADSEGLVASLQGRIVQVDQFLPRLRSMESVVGARPCELAQAPMAPAWQDVDLVQKAHRESLYSSDGDRASTSRASAKSSRSSCGVNIFMAPRIEAWRAPAGHEQLSSIRDSTPVLPGAPSEWRAARADSLKQGADVAARPETVADAASTADTLENVW